MTNIVNIVNRRKSRKLLFQELYAMSLNEFNQNLFRESFFADVFTFHPDESYLTEMRKIVTYYEPFFVSIIKKYTPKFNIKTMSLTYILPIYIGLAEMFFLTEEIPGKVTINEAVEVAKVYGDDSSKKIVNGVLNKVLQDIEELEKLKDNNYSEIVESVFKR